MSREIQVRASLQVLKGSLRYQSQPTAFVADQSGVGGPTPGQISVSGYGTNVSLAALTTPGLVRIMNLDDSTSADYVVYGMYDGTVFLPLGELLPGESFILRLWRHLGDEFAGTGTPADTNFLRMMLISTTDPVGSCPVLVEAFEK